MNFYFLKFLCKIYVNRLYLFATLVLFVLPSKVVISQELHNPSVFQIQQLGIKYSEHLLHESLVKADWCQSINPSSNYKITFDDGAIVNVVSYKELSMQQLAIEESCIRLEDIEDTSIYSINSDGLIIRFVQRVPAKTVIKN